jgi:mono/diheme cytochrome c family protein
MNNDEKQAYLKKYQEAKKKGVPFFPDIVFKDAVISLALFFILIALAYKIGAPLEARANPADTAYTPRPEWYFLFLFQLLKYFPGKLEVIGVVILPTLGLLILFFLPLIDRTVKRHPLSRPVIMLGTLMITGGIVSLTILAAQEAPPPSEVSTGDQIASLYIQNCASCHGGNISIPQGTNLHEVIAKGKHEGMPAWSADLTTNEIDALAGFILSPTGASIFNQYCGTCHKATELVVDQPLELARSIDQGTAYEPHAEKNLPDFIKVINTQERSLLLNFLVAPDGQRLFVTNCASCHGYTISFEGTAEQLREIIQKGGQHLEMPAWQERLSDADLDILAQYVFSPTTSGPGSALFGKNCAVCHGGQIPNVADVAQARQIIATGGAHMTMPVWGDILTNEQLDALVKYTLEAARGTPLELGQQLYSQNCATCHGVFGEGGPSPINPKALIPPISTADYLKTRDDFTLRAIITQGQPNSGMSPFGSAFGGTLEDDEIDAIVAYIRAWEAKPPVDQPPQIAASNMLDLSTSDIYANLCSQCHGLNGEGAVSSSLQDKEFQGTNTDQDIYNIIDHGASGTTMIGWGSILSVNQMQDLVQYIREFGKLAPEPTVETPAPTTEPSAATAEPTAPTVVPTEPTAPTFVKDILPLFNAKCAMCHGSMGGWNGENYQNTIYSGDNGPAVIPGDVDGSLLAQKILGTQTTGLSMPPGSKMTDEEIQLILDWIAAGAPEK